MTIVGLVYYNIFCRPSANISSSVCASPLLAPPDGIYINGYRQEFYVRFKGPEESQYGMIYVDYTN
jgi:hypothetical protein